MSGDRKLHQDTEFLKIGGGEPSKEEVKLPAVELVVPVSISLTFVPGAGTAKTKQIMTSVWHIHSTVAFYFTPW